MQRFSSGFQHISSETERVEFVLFNSLFCILYCIYLVFHGYMVRLYLFISSWTIRTQTNERKILYVYFAPMHSLSVSNCTCSIVPVINIKSIFNLHPFFVFPKCFTFKRPPFVISTAHSFGYALYTRSIHFRSWVVCAFP